MKSIFLAGICVLLLAAAVLPAQTTSQKAAGLGKPGSASNVEMNIRAYIELLRTDVKKEKAQVMGEVMQLDAGQATKFWPIYKQFEDEYSKLGDQIIALVRNYADNFDSLTDTVADQLANQVLSIEQQRNALKKKYYDRMKDGVGAITATRFLQVENQLERLVDLQIAAGLPIVGAK